MSPISKKLAVNVVQVSSHGISISGPASTNGLPGAVDPICAVRLIVFVLVQPLGSVIVSVTLNNPALV